MKRLTFLFVALLCAFHAHSQDVTECRKVVNIAVDAVNNRSTDELKKYLASDFTCAGKSGAIAIKVMELLVNQLNEHISDISEISEQQGNGTLTLVYDFNYSKKLGHKNATFVFNANNQLKQLELLSIQVKTLDRKTDFETPADGNPGQRDSRNSQTERYRTEIYLRQRCDKSLLEQPIFQ